MATKQVTQTHFKLLREIADAEKAPPQMKCIVRCLKEAADGALNVPVTRAALLELLKREPAPDGKTGGLVTNQPHERILSFYRPKMLEMKLISEEKVTEEVTVPDPPAKEGAAEGQPAEAAAAKKSSKGKKGAAKTEEPAPAAEAPAAAKAAQ